MTLPIGIILAGGRALRMGGLDKALCELEGRAMIAHVIDRLRPQCASLAISANGAPARFAAFGLPVLADDLPDFPGPLAGVLAGLDWAAAQGADSIVTVAADTPFLPADLTQRLMAHAGPKGLCVSASPDHAGRLRRHPTCALWPVALRGDLRAALAAGVRKVGLWADHHAPGVAAFASLPFDPFFNVNTPQDLSAAAKMLGQDAPR